MNIGEHFGRISAIYLLVILLVLLISSNSYSFPYKRLDIKIKGTIAEIYDDNTTLTTEDKKEDFITRLTLGLGVNYEGKTGVLGFDGRISQSIFAKRHNFNNFDNMSGSLILNFRNDFSKYHRIRLSNTFTRTFVPGTFEDEFGRIRGRYSSYHNSFNFSYGRDISRKLTAAAKYTNTFDKTSREDSENSYLNSLGFTTNYMHSAVTTFLLSYAFTKRRFEGAEDTSTHTLALAARRRWYISKRLYFDGTVGADFIMNVENNVDTIGENIGVSFTNEIDEDTTVGLSFTKRIRTISTREGHFDSWQVSGSLDRQLLKIKRLNSSFSVFYGQGGSTSSDITDKLLGVNIAFTYAFSKNLSGNLGYTFSDSDSSDESQGYTRNTVSSGLTVGF